MDLSDVVELTRDHPENGPTAGSIGTIVHIFTRPRHAYEVEFTDSGGRTVGTLTLTPDEIRPNS